jgi:hypothetical protein
MWLRKVWPIVVGFAGIVVLACGVAQLFRDNAEGLGSLVTVGAVLLVCPLLIHRIERFVVGADTFELHLAKDIADQGAPGVARLLDHTDLGRLTEAYAAVRAEFLGPANKLVRTGVENALVGRASSFAARTKFDAGEVRRLFRKAAPVTRVLLVGLMKGDPSLADADTLAAAIRAPGSPNEQYHAMELVTWRWATFKAGKQRELRKLTAGADLGKAGSGRRELASRIAALHVTDS